MPVNQLRPFAHADDANITPYNEWTGQALQQVLDKGFQSGIAKSAQVNRAIAQGAQAGYAMGELIKDYADEDATLKPTPLYANFKTALERFVKRQVIGFIYPVGSVYISTVATNPADLFGVGTWQRVGEGRGLIDAGGSIVAGSTGGSDTHTITANEMPSHSHGASASSVGDHSHSARTDARGNHTHTRGSMNITGSFRSVKYGRADGAFTCSGDNGVRHGRSDNDGWNTVYLDASRNWTGETSTAGNHSHGVGIGNAGAHGHTVSVTATGGGQAMSIRNPYLAVYIWKRIA